MPNIVFGPALALAEYRFGPRTSLGTNVYGTGRLTEPWLLQPTEMIDGAVFGTFVENSTWPIAETIMPHLCWRHGVDSNFVGCIVVRSNWEAQAKKQLMANRAVQYADVEPFCLSPQCGFASTEEGNVLSEDKQWRKLELIVELAEEVWDACRGFGGSANRWQLQIRAGDETESGKQGPRG